MLLYILPVLQYIWTFFLFLEHMLYQNAPNCVNKPIDPHHTHLSKLPQYLSVLLQPCLIVKPFDIMLARSPCLTSVKPTCPI